MSLSQDGFCTDCRRWAYECPDLRCPWCHSPKVSDEVLGATDPVGALIDIRTRLGQLAREIASIKHDRRALARHILADPELVMAARRRRVRLSSLDRWAAPPKQKACRRGHDTAEWGDWDGTRWQCRKCAEEGPTTTPSSANVDIAERKERNRIAAAWREHERQMAERARLAALDQVPSRLNPPMAPPTRPTP